MSANSSNNDNSLPPPPPPPPPKVPTPRNSNSRRNLLASAAYSEQGVSGRSSSSSRYDDDYYVCPMEETPLVAHGSRKSTNNHNLNQPPIFQQQQQPSSASPRRTTSRPRQYSAIPEGNGKEEERSTTNTGGSRTASLDDDEDEDDDGNSLGVCVDGDAGAGDDDDDDRSAISTTDSVSSFSTVSSLAENFRDSLLIPFTDDEGSRTKVISGLAALVAVGTVLGLFMPKNAALQRGQRFPWYRYLSSVIGYNYFLLWSVCFYPQALQNYRRKSTKGLSADFAVLNLMGWVFYGAYLSKMYFDLDIRELYAQRFHENSSVASNDVAFAVHAALLAFVYVGQVLYYGKTWRIHLKVQTWILVVGMGGPALFVPILIRSGLWSHRRWLDYFYMLSFFKIGCTLFKYTKQVTLNYRRKSTAGWNIWYNFLECGGGSLSMIQIVLDAAFLNNLSGLTGNLAKFVLGFATIFFDAIFFLQHYVWYAPPKDGDNDVDNEKYNVVLGGGAVKPLPKHLRANSRFEIVIPVNPTGSATTMHHYQQQLGNGNGNGNNSSMVHAYSELSFDCDSGREDGLF